MAIEELGIDIEFQKEGIDEIAVVKNCNNPEYQLPKNKEVLCVDPRYFRPTEVDILIGDASKAKNVLGWKPKYDLRQLISEMVQSDLKYFRKEKYLKRWTIK
jgi:GDPmannose 4,6-dehydratase